MKKTDDTPAPTSAATEFTENFDAQSQGDIVTPLIPYINRLKIFLYFLYNLHTEFGIKQFYTCFLSWQIALNGECPRLFNAIAS